MNDLNRRQQRELRDSVDELRSEREMLKRDRRAEDERKKGEAWLARSFKPCEGTGMRQACECYAIIVQVKRHCPLNSHTAPKWCRHRSTFNKFLNSRFTSQVRATCGYDAKGIDRNRGIYRPSKAARVVSKSPSPSRSSAKQLKPLSEIKGITTIAPGTELTTVSGARAEDFVRAFYEMSGFREREAALIVESEKTPVFLNFKLAPNQRVVGADGTHVVTHSTSRTKTTGRLLVYRLRHQVVGHQGQLFILAKSERVSSARPWQQLKAFRCPERLSIEACFR